jgi:hypothetical protein
MNRHWKHTALAGATAVVTLSLAACVTPQRRPDFVPSASTAQAPGAMQRVASPPPVPMASPVPALAPVQAPADFRQYLETNLMCPTKAVLDVQTARKKALDARLISGKPRESSAGAGAAYLYPVTGDLTVFGFKVVALQFEGSPDNTGKLMTNYGGLYADLDASFEAVEKLVRSRGVKLRKLNGAPGLVATRPGEQFVSLERVGKLVRFGCGIPID